MSLVVWPVLCAGFCFFFFRGRHGHKQDRRKHRVYIESTSSFGVACFTVVVGHCRFHSSGVCLLQQSSQLTQPREDAHCVFAAGNWTERNAAMTQEQHFDQGEMVDGRAATLSRRKITVRCRDTFWRDERHQQEYVEVLRTHATLLPTIKRTVCGGAGAAMAPGDRVRHNAHSLHRPSHGQAAHSNTWCVPGPMPLAAPHAGAPEVCLVTSRTTHRWHAVHFRDQHNGLLDRL